MKVLFFGTPEFAVPTLDKLLSNPKFEVVAVITQPDKPKGRGKQVISPPVKSFAMDHNLPVLQPQRLKKDTETLIQLKTSSADVFVVVAYGQILSSQILDIPTLGCINIHGSILPQYRGAAPIQWSICDGKQETGITTMLMDSGMDTGAILLMEKTAIGLLDNAHDVAERLASLGADLLIETLVRLEQGKIKAVNQDHTAATYAPLIKKEDYQVDWSQTAITIHNKIRGFHPSCVTGFRDQSLKVMSTVPIGPRYWSLLPPRLQELERQISDLSILSGNIGEIVKIAKGVGAIVQTGEGLLLLKQLQVSGKRPLSGWDFVNGMRLQVGEILG